MRQVELEQSLSLQAAHQRVQRALVDLQPALSQAGEQRVAVLFMFQLAEHGQDQHAPAKLQQYSVYRCISHCIITFVTLYCIIYSKSRGKTQITRENPRNYLW